MSTVLHPSRTKIADVVVTHLQNISVGGAFLLTGPGGSGRTSVLADIEHRLSTRGRSILRLSMRGGTPMLFEPQSVDDWLPRADRAGKYIALSAKAIKFFSPEGAVATTAFGNGMKFAAKMGQRWRARTETIAWLPQELLATIRSAPMPTLVLIDDFDEIDLPSWWWSQFLVPLLIDVAGGAEVGVVVAAGGPPSDAGSLTQAFQAGLQHLDLGAVTGEDAARDAPINAGGAELVVALAGSQPALLKETWDELLRLDRQPASAAEMMSLRRSALHRRILRMCPTWTPADVENVLLAAHLQRNFFTAESTAHALHLETDDVIDLLGDLSDKTQPESWVTERDHIDLKSGRVLSRYILSPALHLELSMLATEAERAVLGPLLADALLDDYGAYSWICSSQASTLYRAGGRTKLANEARMLGDDAEQTLLRLQLDTLLAERPGGRDPRQAAQDAFVSTFLLERLAGSLGPEVLVRYCESLRTVARSAGETSETYLLATARHASALACVGGSDSSALTLVAQVLSQTSDSEAALTALHAKMVIQMREDKGVAVQTAELVESLAGRLDNKSTEWQALIMRLDGLYSLGVRFDQLAGGLQRFVRNAQPMETAWLDYHRLVMLDAIQRGDPETLRSEFAAAEKLELARWNYVGAANATMWVLHAEDELRKAGGAVGMDRLRFLATKALAHAEHSGDSQLISRVTAAVRWIPPGNQT